MSGPILVIVEQRGGAIHPGALQCLAAATELASGAEVHALVIGHDVSSVADTVATYGVSAVHVADAASLELYRARPYAKVVEQVVGAISPSAVLLATTFMGRDLAPRVAVRTGAALGTDCVEVSRDGDTIRVRRPMYSGKCFGELTLGTGLAIVSIRPNSYAAPAPGDGGASINAVAVDADDDAVTTREVVRTGGGSKDVTEADIVVAGGRSMKSEENFDILEALAAELDAAVGATRAAVDAGYQPHARQIGLTGKVVTPRLYFACGVDGAIQHLAGMRGSKVIVAINTKADAPIFNVATYGCVADLFDVVPHLTEELRRLKETG